MKNNNEVKNIEKNIVEDVTPNKSKKQLSTKQKGIIIAIVTIILVVALAIGGYFIYQNSRKIDLICDIKSIEYGEKYEPNVSDFVEKKSINDTYTINGEFLNEAEKDYPAIGEYIFTISAKNKDNVNVTVKVEDTTAPVFDENSPSELSTFEDVPITEDVLKNTFIVTDLSPVSLSIDNVDYSTVGEYTTNVYATDDSGNVANKEVKVIVNEPTINVEQSNVSIKVGETIQLNATVQGASQTITWTSSDTSIATVDENGIVTAIKAGSATVTANANGVECSTIITVTSKTNNSSSNSSSNNSSSSSNKKANSSSSSSNSSSSSSSTSSSSSSGNSNSSSSSNSGSSSSSSHQHTMPIGNMGRWFSSKSELISYYQSIVDGWNAKYENGTITWDELMENVPRGYECWSCAGCGKWTGNFKYR